MENLFSGLDFGGEEQKRQRDKQTKIDRNGNRSIKMAGLAKSASVVLFQP